MTDHLKFTAYFAERLRHESRLVSEELLDLCAQDSVATSVVLRGTAGFGPRHELRSDQSLSASEDLPVIIAAVDTAEKIMGLAEQAVNRTTRGLLTLERIRILNATLPDLLAPTKLTIYVGRQQKASGQPAHRAACDLLHRYGFDAAAVFLGVDGTVRGERRRARFFGANTAVPVMIIAVGTGERVAAALPALRQLLPDPLITLEPVELCKREGLLISPPVRLPATDGEGRPLWQKLMIHTSETDLHNGEPIHRAIVRRLQQDPADRGATVLRGVRGFRGDRKPHGDKLIQLGRDVPVTTIIVESPERIAAVFDIVDAMTASRGVVTAELVPALVSIDHGAPLGDLTLARFE